MNKYNRDIDLCIGCTYIFILNEAIKEEYTFIGINNENRLVFSVRDGSYCDFSYFPYENGTAYWKLIRTTFRFGR